MSTHTHTRSSAVSHVLVKPLKCIRLGQEDVSERESPHARGPGGPGGPGGSGGPGGLARSSLPAHGGVATGESGGMEGYMGRVGGS